LDKEIWKATTRRRRTKQRFALRQTLKKQGLAKTDKTAIRRMFGRFTVESLAKSLDKRFFAFPIFAAVSVSRAFAGFRFRRHWRKSPGAFDFQ